MSQNGKEPKSSRNVCWTWNNPPGVGLDMSETEYAAYAQAAMQQLSSMSGCNFVVFQLERGEQGTLHYQGYSEFTKGVKWTAFKSATGVQLHCEARRGSQDSAIDYCCKEEGRIAGPFRSGEPRCNRPGLRTDIQQFRDDIRAGKRRHELEDSHPLLCAKYPKFISFVRNGTRSSFRRKDVVLLVGSPGVGKTRFAEEQGGGDLWVQPIGGQGWFDGYDMQKHALFDDFMGKGSKMRLDDLLRLLDGYSVQVPVKGDFVPWCPETIYITSNYHPREWYDWKDRLPSYYALKRRVTKVHELDISSVHAPEDPEWDHFWQEPELFIETPFFNQRTQ